MTWDPVLRAHRHVWAETAGHDERGYLLHVPVLRPFLGYFDCLAPALSPPSPPALTLPEPQEPK